MLGIISGTSTKVGVDFRHPGDSASTRWAPNCLEVGLQLTSLGWATSSIGRLQPNQPVVTCRGPRTVRITYPNRAYRYKVVIAQLTTCRAHVLYDDLDGPKLPSPPRRCDTSWWHWAELTALDRRARGLRTIGGTLAAWPMPSRRIASINSVILHH